MDKKILILLLVFILGGAGVYHAFAVNSGPEVSKDNSFYNCQESLQVAKQWVKEESPTYTYDGFDLEQKAVRKPEDLACSDCYEFDFSFNSRQGGYGNREGEMLIQVITPHLMTVTVEGGRVVKAITDDIFDEISEELKPEGRVDFENNFEGVEELSPQKEQEVKLYYYNQDQDVDDEGMVLCSADSVEAVSRSIVSEEPIRETIELLLLGQLSEEEKAKGLSTEFPHPEFKLKDLDLEDGVLTLSFSEVPGFSSGGSCRVTLLRAQVEKTALQFSEVEEVRVKPLSVFQP